MEGLFSEHIASKVALRGNVDNAESARISMGKAHKLVFLVSVASLAEDLGITLRQHDAAAAGNSKDLVISNPYFYKLDADAVATKVDAPDTASIAGSELNNNAGYIAVEVLSEDLDVNGNFSYVSVQLADTTGAREGQVIAMSHMPRLKPAYEVEL